MIYAIDCSASMDPAALMQICAHVSGRPDATRAIIFDTEMVKVVPARGLSPKDLRGRGGTSLQPVFDWMKGNAPTEDLTVITDGLLAGPIRTHGVRAACLLTMDDGQTRRGLEDLRAFQRIAQL